MNQLFKFSLGILFMLMIVFPGLLQPVKLVFLGFSIIFGLSLRNGQIYIDKGVLSWMLIYVMTNLFYMVLSIIHGNDALSYMPVLIFEPIALFLIVLLFNNDLLHFAIKAVVVSSYILVIYDTVFLMSINGILPAFFHDLMIGIKANYGGVLFGFVKYSADNVSWMMFLAPLFIAVFLTTNIDKLRKHSLILIAAFAIHAVIVMRTALFLCFIIGIFLTVIFTKISKQSISRKSLHMTLFAIIVFLMIGIFGFSQQLVSLLSEDIISAFSLETSTNSLGVVDAGGRVRYEQFIDLIYTWSIKPIFGWGVPSNSLNIVRSNVLGAYELTYIAMLMQRGLLGIFIYFALIVWLFLKNFQIAKENSNYSKSSICIMVALSAAIFANFTNPYIDNFDRLIIQFLPLIFINLKAMDLDLDVKYNLELSTPRY